MTEVIAVRTVDEGDPGLRRAAEVLCSGGLVAFPTETVYGLGANGLDGRAVARIFAAKGRPADNPLILHVASEEEAARLVEEFPAEAARLAAAFWPGPLTLVLRRRPHLPPAISAGLPTVAVRIPAHPVALGLIRAAGVPVAAPSANISGRPSPTTAAHVLADLEGAIDLILDAGPTAVGLESTVVDLSGGRPRLLRPGGVTVEALRAVLGEDRLILGPGDATRPASPGMKYRHYAPEAPLTLFLGDPASTAAAIAARMREAAAAGRRAAALVHTEALSAVGGAGLALDLGPRTAPEEAARRLFALLRRCNTEGVDAIFVQGPPEEGLGSAVLNRLYKAADGRIVHVGG